MSNETATATATAAVKPEFVPQSEKLTALKDAVKAAWKIVIGFDDPFSKEAKDAKLAFLKAEGEVKAEESALIKAENDRKAAEAKNARIGLVDTMISAYDAMSKAPKSTAADKMAELTNAYNTAREVVVNELLAKFGGNKPAKEKAEGETGRDSESKQAILEMFHAGKTHKEIEEAGYARSTVWHTINNYKKANQQ